MKYFSKLAFIVLFTLPIVANANCQKLYSSLENQLNININEFDQQQNKGWRILAQNKCYKQAAQLIEQYIKLNKNITNEALKWHLFQMKSMAGETELAIKLGHEILAQAQNSPTEFLWREYVAATIAFLEDDRKSLLVNRNALASKQDFKPNKMNLIVLDRLIANIKKPYVEAYFE
mgnify:CR=1 FL=1